MTHYRGRSVLASSCTSPVGKRFAPDWGPSPSYQQPWAPSRVSVNVKRPDTPPMKTDAEP